MNFLLSFFLFGLVDQLHAAQVKPQITNQLLITNNPTLTTIALEKPFCVFGTDGSCNNCNIYLYAVDVASLDMAVVDDNNVPLNSTFQRTNGGKLGPYKAASFGQPSCKSPPQLDNVQDLNQVAAILDGYLVRVGDDVNCLTDPNYLGACNPPLSQGTTYRFRYILVTREGKMSDQTLWSDPITTKTVKDPSWIDAWPGRRSGGMIVITSILSVLIFLLLVAFVAAILTSVMGGPSGANATTHETQTTQQAVSEPYSGVLRGSSLERDRYVPKPQA
ncbi:uroplakin-3a [Rhinatrema bivittatum]|uniref:uroplakin-3a n=1 Tax=Rhinatrema bivittatum TaxID=194408 RepID=UPI001126D67E|nr:uroplakin-3a [Rhinatrema bivittatum]